MAPTPISWRMAISRQYRNDPDLRVAVNSMSLALLVAIVAATYWNILSYSYFAMFGIVLLSSVYYARKRSWNFAIALQAAFLGYVFGTAVVHLISSSDDRSWMFALYVATMAVFHFTEFFFTAISNRRGLQADSFLLNHSVPYWVAASSSWFEFGVEAYLLPSIKVMPISLFGFFICAMGEAIRKTAMLHAGNGFTHRLALSKRPDHRLCTTGVYGWVRHPGYCGWFLWSVGTQLILVNPICIVIYAAVTWKFFDERIVDEERDLIHFFGNQYIDYQDKVWGGIPFVRGWKLNR